MDHVTGNHVQLVIQQPIIIKIPNWFASVTVLEKFSNHVSIDFEYLFNYQRHNSYLLG